jgi:hypothetical protein
MRTAKYVLAAAGAVCLLGWAVIPRSSVLIGWHNNSTGGTFTLSQANALCSSTLGQWGQAFSAAAAAKCGQVAHFYDAVAFLGFTGLALLIAAGFAWHRSAAQDRAAQDRAARNYYQGQGPWQ